MIIDGVKWACDACIRGHRVSGCTHSDRELKQIAKKGRPVSQCPHCRHLRKSRSAHVKCDCGEKHSKDHAAKKGGAACCGVTSDNKGDSKASSQPCQCCHGRRCSCALKKETKLLDTVPEFLPELKHTVNESRRPRIQSTQSESSLTTFMNGHHKPTHKSHHGHSISPYTIAGHADHHRHSFLDDDDIHPPLIHKTRRMKSDVSSSDLLALSRLSNMLAMDHSSVELTPRQIAPRQLSSRMQPGLSVNTNSAQFSIHDNFSQDYLQSADSDPRQFSAGLQPSVAWPSYSTFDFDWIYPGMTSSSSGDENDELSMQTADLTRSMPGTGPLPSEASDLGDDSYRLSAASSFIGMPNTGLLGGNRLDEYNNVERYLALDYMSNTLESTKQLNLERFLADSTAQKPGYLDGGLSMTMLGESPFDTDSQLFANTYLSQQQIHESTETLDLLVSNLHSPATPAESGMLLGMATPLSGEENDFVWMRKVSNASTSAYQSPLDQSWHNTSQAQSPR